MRRRVTLATAVLVLAGGAGLFAWHRDHRSLECAAGAERVDFTVAFDHPDARPIRLEFEIAPEGAAIRRPPSPLVLAHRTPAQARQMIEALLEPLHQPPPPDARPPHADLTLTARCNGGREHSRELFTLERSMKLGDCLPALSFELGALRAIDFRERAACVAEWWKAPHPWSWREREDRAAETGYRAWGMLLSLEHERAEAAAEATLR